MEKRWYITTEVEKCDRCGRKHRLKFHRLDYAAVKWPWWWATCPLTGDPVLMKVERAEDCPSCPTCRNNGFIQCAAGLGTQTVAANYMPCPDCRGDVGAR